MKSRRKLWLTPRTQAIEDLLDFLGLLITMGIILGLIYIR